MLNIQVAAWQYLAVIWMSQSKIAATISIINRGMSNYFQNKQSGETAKQFNWIDLMVRQIEVTLMVMLVLMATVAVKGGVRKNAVMSTCYRNGGVICGGVICSTMNPQYESPVSKTPITTCHICG